MVGWTRRNREYDERQERRRVEALRRRVDHPDWYPDDRPYTELPPMMLRRRGILWRLRWWLVRNFL